MKLIHSDKWIVEQYEPKRDGGFFDGQIDIIDTVSAMARDPETILREYYSGLSDVVITLERTEHKDTLRGYRVTYTALSHRSSKLWRAVRLIDLDQEGV